MPRRKTNQDFDIYIDQSCQNTPMCEEGPQSQTTEAVDINTTSSEQDSIGTNQNHTEQDISETVDGSNVNQESIDNGACAIEEENMTDDPNRESDVRQSIEIDRNEANSEDPEQAGHPEQNNEEHEDVEDGSMISDTTDNSNYQTREENTYPDRSEFATYRAPHVDDGDGSSSHHEATDEDVFSDKSPRSSLGSYDGIPEPGKTHRDSDNMTTVIRSPRISDISQYEREYEKKEFIPTVRGTPRPPFRTPSDVRAMQMSSPPPSVLGSPRSAKRQFPTVSRLGTPNASAQYSPKMMSTPSRFKGRKEAPLVLLHVTLLPLRWEWGDLLNNLEMDDLSDQVKALQESWRILKDRVDDTIIERGVLLGHPQSDYEVLEERLLETLELPHHRRARILECGHYLGPANETALTEGEESEDEWDAERTKSIEKHYWCSTCKNEIRYDSLGSKKIFRVKVYASNGLMKTGAWEVCWKEMERVDVELEPMVEPALQEELVRLAAIHQEREFAQQEEADIAKEVAEQMEQEHRKEQEDLLNSHYDTFSPPPERVGSSMSADISPGKRRQRDEERLREIYGHTPPPQSPTRSQFREPSVHSRSHRQRDSYIPSPSPSPSTYTSKHPEESYEHGSQQGTYQNASLPELMLQSIRVLMQDRKNIIIFTLSIFVLMLALRNAPAPSEPTYEPVIHRIRDMPVVRRTQAQSQIHDIPQVPIAQMKVPIVESFTAASICDQSSSVTSQEHTPSVKPIAATSDYQELPDAIHHTPIVEPMSTSEDSFQQETNFEPMVDEPKNQEPSESMLQYSTSIVDTPTTTEYFQESSTPAVEEEELNDETTDAIPNEEESIYISQPDEVEESIAELATVSTVYEPCNTRASQGSFYAATLEETETETVTEKKVVRVFHTVTETEVETSTATIKVAPTDLASKQDMPSTIPEETSEDPQESESEEPVTAEAVTDVDL
ncbi:uncharacterized protein F4822DRAFT_273234 [Hypoxylon trugodes]|uniref:uncharacterized protein n=1 Tax=Hypoxylon trugodes TaxID=326681 RepID=UPI00219B69A7|nr:uncharacterized protein F4822DRAFT_273234 [Hypoxylon trugodes]KAI1389223.1 hypothetical protein F4822DRAFT_273234 [Hypoxylon trugodes]